TAPQPVWLANEPERGYRRFGPRPYSATPLCVASHRAQHQALPPPGAASPRATWYRPAQCAAPSPACSSRTFSAATTPSASSATTMPAVASHGASRYSPTSVTSRTSSNARRSTWNAWYRLRPSVRKPHVATATAAVDDPSTNHRAHRGSSCRTATTSAPPTASTSSPPATAGVHDPRTPRPSSPRTLP